MWIGIFLVIVIVVIGITADFKSVNSNVSKTPSAHPKEDLGGTKKMQHIRNVNTSVFKKLGNIDTYIKYYLVNNYNYNKDALSKQVILVNNENKKIVFIDYESCDYEELSFIDFINYEIYEEKSKETEGGFIGTLLPTETVGKTNHLRLILTIKNLNKPQIVYNIFDSAEFFNVGLLNNCEGYNQMKLHLQKVVSLLEVIKNQNKN